MLLKQTTICQRNNDLQLTFNFHVAILSVEKLDFEEKLSHYHSIAQTTLSNTKKGITIVMVMCLNQMFYQAEGGRSVTLNTTELMNIFIPQGDLIGQTNFATLRTSMNISTLFLESREVCTITALMKESLSKILKNN